MGTLTLRTLAAIAEQRGDDELLREAVTQLRELTDEVNWWRARERQNPKVQSYN